MYNDKIAKVLSMLKEFLKYANQKNYPVNKEFFEYEPTLPQSRKAVRYLTTEELKTIISLELEQGGSMDMTRDFFVFQCFTALRYSDIKQLKHLTMLRRKNFSEKFVILKTLYTFVA